VGAAERTGGIKKTVDSKGKGRREVCHVPKKKETEEVCPMNQMKRRGPRKKAHPGGKKRTRSYRGATLTDSEEVQGSLSIDISSFTQSTTRGLKDRKKGGKAQRLGKGGKEDTRKIRKPQRLCAFLGGSQREELRGAWDRNKKGKKNEKGKEEGQEKYQEQTRALGGRRVHQREEENLTTPPVRRNREN